MKKSDADFIGRFSRWQQYFAPLLEDRCILLMQDSSVHSFDAGFFSAFL
jgi:hypothetical protein